MDWCLTVIVILLFRLATGGKSQPMVPSPQQRPLQGGPQSNQNGGELQAGHRAIHGKHSSQPMPLLIDVKTAAKEYVKSNGGTTANYSPSAHDSQLRPRVIESLRQVRVGSLYVPIRSNADRLPSAN